MLPYLQESLEELALCLRERNFDIVPKVPAGASRHRQKVRLLRVLRAGQASTQDTRNVQHTKLAQGRPHDVTCGCFGWVSTPAKCPPTSIDTSQLRGGGLSPERRRRQTVVLCSQRGDHAIMLSYFEV